MIRGYRACRVRGYLKDRDTQQVLNRTAGTVGLGLRAKRYRHTATLKLQLGRLQN